MQEFGTLDVVKILGIGISGLGFLLAVLSYFLLKDIVKQANVSSEIVRVSYAFMGFSSVLCVIGLVAQLLNQNAAQEELARLQPKYDRLVQSAERLRSVSGKIDEPSSGKTVNRIIDLRGRIEGYRADSGLQYWLVVEADGALWARDTPLAFKADGTWSAQISQNPAPGRINIALVVADEIASGEIRDWLNDGAARNQYQRVGRFRGNVLTLSRAHDLAVVEKSQSDNLEKDRNSAGGAGPPRGLSG